MANQFEKAFISLRVLGHGFSEKALMELLDTLDIYPGIVDEISFFTAETHPPLPLDVLHKKSGILRERMIELRRRGYRTGINILATIGHHEENLAHSLVGPYARMTDIEGKVCQGSFCFNDDRFQDYVIQAYRSLALAEPDYIWIDDDIRLCGHMPIVYTCFCEHCIQKFNHANQTEFQRSSLKQAFNEGPLAEKLAWRKAWLTHNKDTITRLLQLIATTVHEINPDIALGFMTGDRFYEGYDFQSWEYALSGNGAHEVMWRPGCGFYFDERLLDMAVKSHQIGRQVALLSDHVYSIQSEIENFPYQRLKKSSRVTALEAASHIAAGCTGAAFNVLTGFHEPLDEYAPILAELHAFRPFYDRLAARLGRFEPIGIAACWGKDSFVARQLEAGNWFEGGDLDNPIASQGNEIYELGLPPSYKPNGSMVTLLSGEGIRAFSSEDIRSILSAGVYMDAKALETLNSMGYRDYTGFEVAEFIRVDCMERFTGHALNDGLEGRKRDCRQSFTPWHYTAAALRSVSEGTAAISELTNYVGELLGSTGTGIFENEWGGRICVAGYYPWTFLKNEAKTIQMKHLMLWLSKENLPAYVPSYHSGNLWVRHIDEGKIGIVYLNASLDPAVNLKIKIKTKHSKITVTDTQLQQTVIHESSQYGEYREFQLPPIQGWDIRFIEV